jgi:hypothetical protein
MIGPLDAAQALSHGQESPGTRKQAVRRKPERPLDAAQALSHGRQLEPQKLCRASYPKGRRKRVKRGNPRRCNLRKERHIGCFPKV